MGIYIKGMEMPEKCEDCCFYSADAYDECLGCTLKHYLIIRMHGQDKTSWCPLVEVKVPHGKLMDRDAIKANTIPLSFLVQNWIDEVTLDTRIPTVIEAEGAKE